MPTGYTNKMMPMPMPNQGNSGTPSYNQNSPLYYSDPGTIIQPTYSNTPYKSSFDPNNPLSSLIERVGGLLKPQKAFTTDVMSYDTYAAPQRAVFDQWAKGFRDEFEKGTLNPWNLQYGNKAATSGMSQMGNAKDLYGSQKQGIERQGYFDPLQQATDSYNDMILKGYQDRIRKYYDSPTAFNNIGDPTAMNGSTPPMQLPVARPEMPGWGGQANTMTPAPPKTSSHPWGGWNPLKDAGRGGQGNYQLF